MKTQFRFRCTAFNCTEPKDYFINDGCFGDDVAEWLMVRLRSNGIQTGDKPHQEDFGWYFTFHADGNEHCVVISFQPNNPPTGDRWLGWIERHRSFFGSILGGRDRGISEKAVSAVDTVLKSSPDIHDLAWTESGT